MNRRALLVNLLAFGAGAGGYAFWRGDVTREDVAETIADEPPATENKIAEAQAPGYEPIKRVVFYESGGTEIHLQNSHPYEHIGVTHAALNIYEDRFQSWDAPKYGGPLVVDLKTVLQNNGPYPNNRFTIDGTRSPNEGLFTDGIDFRAPASYVEGQLE